MRRIILGHPYSGALHGYIADQMQGDYSHTRAIGSHPYYTTLYGRDYLKYVERALMFTLLYDEIYFTPADNPWPKSELTTSRDYHPELGLHADWGAYGKFFSDDEGFVASYLSDPEIKRLLGTVFRIPQDNWQMVMSSILYEYLLSREHRCPIVCSFGRRQILERMVEIDQPSLHPQALAQAKVEVVENYLDITGLLLAPGDLDNLLKLKADKTIRSYSSSFLSMLSEFESSPSESVRANLVGLMREAMETESIGKQAVGLMSWVGRLLRLFGQHHFSIATAAVSYGAQYVQDGARWHALAGEVRRFEEKSLLIEKLESEKQRLNREQG